MISLPGIICLGSYESNTNRPGREKMEVCVDVSCDNTVYMRVFKGTQTEKNKKQMTGYSDGAFATIRGKKIVLMYFYQFIVLC